MLTIRLQRRGRTNDPSFRVILVESKRAAKTGSFQEVLGSYDPRVDRIDLKVDRIKHWLGMGVTLSDTVHNMFVSQKIIDAKKINVLPKKTVAKVEQLAAEAAAPAEAVSEASVAETTEEKAEATSPEANAEAPTEEPVSNDVAAETPAQ
ncbi:MAG TPA: 30S ribosomal protein S16 [Candidatus Paceibacterota bacterium]|nr:30S ribosomal protein S16 [Candidatus Paceibacterota bacterium]